MLHLPRPDGAARLSVLLRSPAVLAGVVSPEGRAELWYVPQAVPRGVGARQDGLESRLHSDVLQTTLLSHPHHHRVRHPRLAGVARTGCRASLILVLSSCSLHLCKVAVAVHGHRTEGGQQGRAASDCGQHRVDDTQRGSDSGADDHAADMTCGPG